MGIVNLWGHIFILRQPPGLYVSIHAVAIILKFKKHFTEQALRYGEPSISEALQTLQDKIIDILYSNKLQCEVISHIIRNPMRKIPVASCS